MHGYRHIFSFILLLAIVSSACSSNVPLISPEPAKKPTATFKPKPTPTAIPIGTSGNPLTIGFIEPPDETGVENIKELVDQLANLTGYDIQAVQFKSYNELMYRMRISRVHLAWLQPFTYIYGKQNGFARVLLLTSHFGVFKYGTQFMANSTTGFTSYYDASTGLNTREEAFALTQLQGKRPCWVDPTSASGYILPLSLLADNNIGVFEGVFAHNHAAVVRSLYVSGICDFGATFSISGDPRTSSSVIGDSPDVIKRVPIIWRSDALIPNTNLAIHPNIKADMSENIAAAFMEFIKTPEGKQIISGAINYSVEDFLPVNDEVYRPLEHSVDVLGLNLETLIGK